MKFGETARKGDGRRLLNKRMSGEEALGGELLREEGWDGVLEKSCEWWGDWPESARCGSGTSGGRKQERRHGKRKRDN